MNLHTSFLSGSSAFIFCSSTGSPSPLTIFPFLNTISAHFFTPQHAPVSILAFAVVSFAISSFWWFSWCTFRWSINRLYVLFIHVLPGWPSFTLQCHPVVLQWALLLDRISLANSYHLAKSLFISWSIYWFLFRHRHWPLVLSSTHPLAASEHWSTFLDIPSMWKLLSSNYVWSYCRLFDSHGTILLGFFSFPKLHPWLHCQLIADLPYLVPLNMFPIEFYPIFHFCLHGPSYACWVAQ